MTKIPKVPKSVEPKPRKRATADDPVQYKHFREFAREHETDESKQLFDNTFRTLVKKPADR